MVRIVRGVVVALALLAGLLVPTGSAQAATPKRCGQPAAGATVQTASPANERMDAAKLDRAVTELSLRLRLSVKVFRHGCLVAHGPLDPVTDNVHNNLWSATKSVVALAAGIAVHDGRLRLSDRIGRYLPKGADWGDAAHRRITVRELLEQRSGLRESILAEAGTIGLDQSLPREALSQPFVYPRGKKFQYSQLGPALLAYVVQRAVKEDLQSYLQRKLFGPIGIKKGSYFWLRDRSGMTYGYNNLFVTPEQFTRIGLLLGNKGRWRGHQVIPASYVKALGARSQANGCYGLLFWTNAGTPCTGGDLPAATTVNRRWIPSAPKDMFQMNGAGGQIATVVPSLGLTIVTTGYFGDLYPDPDVLLGVMSGDMQYRFMRGVTQSVQDVHVPDPGPYTPDPVDLNADPRNYADARVVLDDLASNPSCNVLVCDGTVPTRGLIQDAQALPGLL